MNDTKTNFTKFYHKAITVNHYTPISYYLIWSRFLPSWTLQEICITGSGQMRVFAAHMQCIRHQLWHQVWHQFTAAVPAAAWQSHAGTDPQAVKCTGSCLPAQWRASLAMHSMRCWMDSQWGQPLWGYDPCCLGLRWMCHACPQTTNICKTHKQVS